MWILTDAENVIIEECKNKSLHRKDIAQSYRLALQAEPFSPVPIDWSKINQAIIKRWSVSGLNWIKKMAWNGKCFRKELK